MRAPWRRPALPPGVASVLPLARGERVLEWANEAAGAVLVVSTTHLYAAAGGEVVLARPWHLVDAGRWNRDTSALTVTWVDGQRRSRWTIDEGAVFLQALRERVQASVVLSEAVDLGEGRSARVVVRRDLATDRLLGQTILGRGIRADDPGVAEATAAALAALKEQVGR